MLKEEARRQGKPFGLLFDNIEGGFTFTGRSTPNAFNVLPNIVYRVYADGRPLELVRGVDLDRHAARRVRQDPRRERRHRRLQRPVRRRKRQRPGLCLVARAARQRSRGSEESAVAGNAADSAGARAEAEVVTNNTVVRRSAFGVRRSSSSGVAGVSCAVVCRSAHRSRRLVAAMKDELARSMSGLRIKDEPPPYYIEYHVDETVTMRTAARLGAIEVHEPGSRLRTLDVEVRVGDYQFDSSRFVTQGRGGFAPQGEGSAVTTLDDNYDAIRHQLWLATDAAYKRALSTFARKKAAFQNRANADPLPDFSRETPVDHDPADAGSSCHSHRLGAARSRSVGGAPIHFAASILGGLGRRAVRHALLPQQRRLHGGDADRRCDVRGERRCPGRRRDDAPRLRIVFGEPARADAAARRPDGRARGSGDRLTASRTAPLGEEYTGPVLFEGRAGAEILAQSFVPLLLAERGPDSDNPRFARQPSTPFLTRIGLRVMAESFSVSDTPSLSQFAGRPVPGAYEVDDEGVPAQDVPLVENGRLLMLLTNRTPNATCRSRTVMPGATARRPASCRCGAAARFRRLR